MAGEFTLDFKQSQKLEAKLKTFSGDAEKTVNEVLKRSGSKAVMQSIISFMPVSQRNKKHAKMSNPLKASYFNLGFRVFAKGGAANKPGSFGYLVFPDEGRGPHQAFAQEFFQRGGETASEQVLNDVIAALDKAANFE